jgi:hypothetical protein
MNQTCDVWLRLSPDIGNQPAQLTGVRNDWLGKVSIASGFKSPEELSGDLQVARRVPILDNAVFYFDGRYTPLAT